MQRVVILICVMLAARPGQVLALPLLSDARQVAGVTLFPDLTQGSLFYYSPRGLRLQTDVEGRPDLEFLQVRYVGTRAAGDQGETLFRSLLALGVEMESPEQPELDAARRELEGRLDRRIELRPLPVGRVEAVLLYSDLGGQDGAQGETVLPGGHFEATDEHGKSGAASYWRKRRFNVRLDTHSAQLLWQAFHRGQVALSLAYAFLAPGSVADDSAHLSGTPEMVAELERRLAPRGEANGGDSGPELHVVTSGATSVSVDAERWPDLLRQLDLNEQMPPGYALLDVYCYDFRDGLRPELDVKKVEVEANGVSGALVRQEVIFERRQPDLYGQSLRFPFAVRMDSAYRYRVSEIARSGNLIRGEWVEVGSWAGLLDVTSRPAEQHEGPASSGDENDEV